MRWAAVAVFVDGDRATVATSDHYTEREGRRRDLARNAARFARSRGAAGKCYVVTDETGNRDGIVGLLLETLRAEGYETELRHFTAKHSTGWRQSAPYPAEEAEYDFYRGFAA